MLHTFKIFDSLDIVEGQIEISELLETRDILDPRNQVVLEVENLQTAAPPVQVLYPDKLQLKKHCRHIPLVALIMRGLM